MTPFRERNPIVVGLVSIVILSGLMTFAFSLQRFTFLTGRYVIEADFADAAGLVSENEVRIAGLKVGKVRSIELAGPEDTEDRVRVTMEIEGDIRIGNASTAEIKLETILGAKFVSIDPRGGSPYLDEQEDPLISLDRTSIPFEIYEVTNQTVDKLGRLDAEALNEALRELALVTEDPEGDFGRALDGLAEATAAVSERDAELESLIRGADPLLDALGSRSAELGRIIDNGAEILTVLEQRREALKGFVRGTDRLAGELGGLLRDTRSDLDPALRDLHEILEVVDSDLGPLEDAVRVLGVDSESFARIFLQGTWGNVYLQSLGTPIPVPSLGAEGSSDGVAPIFEAAGGTP